MKMITIAKVKHVEGYILEISFDDDCVKQFDFSKLISFTGMAEPLKNPEYFKTAEIISDGRAFGWENGYDCCADWARYFAKDLADEWNGFDDTIDLKQRIKITQQKVKHEHS